MQNARYFVVSDRDMWLIKYNDEEFGPYLTRSEATLFAVDAAKKLSDRGERAEVYALGDNGKLRREWTSGKVAGTRKSGASRRRWNPMKKFSLFKKISLAGFAIK
jgi:hypothetical protein